MIKILANENIPYSSIRILIENDIDIKSVGIDFKGITDEEVVKLSNNENRTIITFDNDYGELIFRKGFEPGAGVILFRWDIFQPEDIGRYLVDLLNSSNINFSNRLTGIKKNSIRQRRY